MCAGERRGWREGGRTCGGARVAWLSPILENISRSCVSGCGICFAVTAAASAARSDGATNYTDDNAKELAPPCVKRSTVQRFEGQESKMLNAEDGRMFEPGTKRLAHPGQGRADFQEETECQARRKEIYSYGTEISTAK